MKEFKGTKQEWVRDGRMVYALQGDENRFYAAFYPGRCCSPDEALANAKLARAAPDLLNELKKLREYVINVCDVDEEDCHSEHPLMSSRAAISKALEDE
ncbi:hypothetical protein [Enterobacter cloacae]|uniref:hypothetical protein n=1 Tax=Enterobacter cloacae TaxID=550 RepID=UPI002931C8D4|nr:hypothetical protein [Enterobacter cloacae]